MHVRHIILGSLVSTAVAGLPTIAHAASDTETDRKGVEVYLEARGGLNILPRTTVTFNPQSPPAQQGQLRTRTGYAIGGAAGVRFADSIRLEGEVMYRANRLRSVTVPRFADNTGGDFNSLVLAANAYYDLPGANIGAARLRPYAGAGLAYVEEVDLDILNPNGNVQFSTSRLGFQLLTGVNFEWESGLRAGFGARWLSASSARLRGPLGEFRSSYRPVTLTASIGYRF
jgi:opacity protein-like surface antigen